MVLCLLASHLFAQPLVSITDFSGPEALNGNLVTGMTTDRRGLLWLSTWGGLYRYDGYQFVSYKVRPGDGNDLDNSRLDDVQQDIHGNLICRSYDTFYLYDIETNRFRKLKGAKGIEAGRHRLHFSGVFNRDGYHLEKTHGRYTAACTWFEALTGISVVGNPWHPETVSPDTALICQKAAHAACRRPWRVTRLK